VSEWGSHRLSEVADLCLGKMLDQKKNKGELRPYLGNLNVRWGTIELDDLKEMRFEDRELDRYGLRNGDIVMCEGGEPGRCALWTGQAPTMMIQKALHRIRPFESVDSQFLFYALFHKGRAGGFDAYFTGATIKHLPGEQLAKIEVQLPPTETQRRIAGILGAYDDLIEVNRRRVAVLEDMARGLFEEWFVRLRFPGHESVPLHNTPDGPLPEGWRWGAFGDLVTELRVSVQPADIEPDAVYLGLEHLPRRSTTLADKGAAGDVSSMKLRFQRGDILFGKIRPYFHKVVWAPFDGVCSSDAIVWRPVARHQAQALAIASSDVFVNHSVQTSNGTKMPRANPKVLSQFKCAMAPAVLSDQFERLCLPLVEAAAAYQAANQRLTASRDLLLPRLMSGGLSVAEAQKELEIA